MQRPLDINLGRRAILILAALCQLVGCRHEVAASLQGSGGLMPQGDERFLAIPLVKHESQFYGRDCPPGQAFFSYCGATKVTDELAITSRHCVIKDGGPADVYWFQDEAAVHAVLNEREECLDIEATTARLVNEAKGQKIPKEGIFAPRQGNAYVTNPDFAMIIDPRLRSTPFFVLPLADPASIPPGTTVMRIAFGSVDCRAELPADLQAKYPGYRYYYDRHRVTRYGTSKAFGEFVDRDGLGRYSKSMAESRDFEDYIYYVSGKDGIYGCLGDSSASLVQVDGVWHIIGVHKGGLPIYDEAPGAQPKTPTPFKLEIGVKISAQNVCAFAAGIPAAVPVFAGVCNLPAR